MAAVLRGGEAYYRSYSFRSTSESAWATVISRSFNFTKAAEENNAEKLLVLRDRQLAGR